jgi:hypothetical protein
MAGLTPLNDKALESKVIRALQERLKAFYPSRWNAFDSRVASMLDLYIRLANTTKQPLTGFELNFARYMTEKGIDSQLSADFINALAGSIRDGIIPSNPLQDVIGYARGTARQIAAKQAEKIAETQREKEIKEISGDRDYMDEIFGSLTTSAKILPWVVLAAGGLYLYSISKPIRMAGKFLK